jgi:hypothetical protein
MINEDDFISACEDALERQAEEDRRELQAADDAERDEMAACARLEEVDSIAAVLRDAIERQIATVPSGKKLTAYDAAAVANLVTNIVGNLTYAVANLIEDERDR